MKGRIEQGLFALGHRVLFVILPLKQLADQRHTHELAVFDLTEVGGPGVLVHFGKNLVHPGKGMEHCHLLLCERHSSAIQHETVLYPVELVLVEEPLLLDPGHIEHVELRHHFVQIIRLAILYAHLLAHVLLDVVGQLQLVRCNQDDPNALVAGQGLDKGVDGASESEVAAEAYADVPDVAQLPLDCQKVGKSLGGVAVASVPGVDDRHCRDFCRCERSSLYVVPHRNHVGKAAYHPDGVLDGLALADRRTLGVRKSQYIASELHHCRGETQPCTGTRLIEQGGQLAVGHHALILAAVCDYVFRHCNDLVRFLAGQVGRIDKVFHCCDYKLFLNSSMVFLSSGLM